MSSGKEVLKRWVNIRDSYHKSLKKEKSVKKSGAGAAAIRKYVYFNQLQFLNKVFCERPTENSLSADQTEYITTEDSSAEGGNAEGNSAEGSSGERNSAEGSSAHGIRQ